MRRGSWLCLLALAAAAPAARAEQVYVIEQLVVAVASEPGQGAGERVGQVKSGDKLELIERQGDEAHVRLPNGKDGWVKASYVSEEEPLTHRLSERTAEVDKLKQDVSRLESELATARAARIPAPTSPTTPAEPPTSRPTSTSARTQVSPANNTPDPSPSTASMSEAQPGREAVFLRSPDQTSQTPWEWVLGTSAVMLLAGFMLGWRTLDRRIRRKYGGLRIY
jgi:SH3 domain protein